jgi:cytochrome P450
MEVDDVAVVEELPRRRGCPIDHKAFGGAKTSPKVETGGAPIEQDAAGVWHVRSYEAVRAVLRSNATKQAGFKAELLEGMARTMRPPVLYQDGQEHHLQRKQTARFFTPKAVSENYRQLMEHLADQIVAELIERRRADLSALSMRLAVRVASEVVGLTDSRLPGMDQRLNAFFMNDVTSFSWRPRALLELFNNHTRILKFFYLDVKPAIKARRRAPKNDVISHLSESGYRDSEILTECITYGAAGMATTREFISVAAWHMLEQPELRAHYLAGDEQQRQVLLQEILRLEPVVGHLQRRATADIEIEADGASMTIPAGALIDLHISGANTDPAAVGAQPLAICPARELQADRATPAVMSFGDGAHRCPGAYIAIQETDLFLQRLLRVPGLHIERAPTVTWSKLTAGYELRDFIIAVD